MFLVSPEVTDSIDLDRGERGYPACQIRVELNYTLVLGARFTWLTKDSHPWLEYIIYAIYVKPFCEQMKRWKRHVLMVLRKLSVRLANYRCLAVNNFTSMKFMCVGHLSRFKMTVSSFCSYYCHKCTKRIVACQLFTNLLEPMMVAYQR